jgi:hypothetical protein
VPLIELYRSLLIEDIRNLVKMPFKRPLLATADVLISPLRHNKTCYKPTNKQRKAICKWFNDDSMLGSRIGGVKTIVDCRW